MSSVVDYVKLILIIPFMPLIYIETCKYKSNYYMKLAKDAEIRTVPSC